MIKRAVILFFSVAFIVSCNRSRTDVQKPADFLDKGTMAAVLTDLTLMEAASNNRVMQGAPNTAVEDLKFNVYKQHMISRKQYEASLNYYCANVTEFKEVYEIVLQNLNKQKGN